MHEGDNSKRGFFKGMLAAIGLLVGTNYVMKLASGRRRPSKDAKAKSEHEDDLQSKAWLQHQQVLMTDNEKQHMLDEIINLHNKHNA